MARYYIKMDTWEDNFYKATNNDTRFDPAVLGYRDKARTVLDPGATGNTWVVSDVIKWQGNAPATGYAFYIEHRNGAGTPTGPMWLIILCGRGRFGGNTADPNEILSTSDASINDYFEEPAGFTSFVTDGSLLIHYNDTGGTSTPYASGTTWNADGSLTGGDLSAPTTNPYNNLANFFPSATDILGPCFNDDADGANFALILDDTKPFLAAYRTPGRSLYIRNVAIMGEIIDPYLGTDTFTAGNVHLEIEANGSITNNANKVYCYDSTGARSRENLNFITSFNTTNETFADGTYPFDIATIAGPSLFKGYVDADIIKVIGASNEGYLSLYEQNSQTFLKVQDQIALPYVANTPIFPAE